MSEEVNEESETDMKESCQRVVPSFPKDLCDSNLTSMPIKSQIVIMSNTENPLSSDESINIDVGLESTELNPLGSVDVSHIPMEIVENLFDDGDNSLNNVTVIDSHGSVQRKFLPLTDEQRQVASLKLSLVLNLKEHKVNMEGNDTILNNPPTVTEKSRGDGACLFNTFSLLLSGRQTYNAIIRHVICNYIANPLKYGSIKSYLPTRYKNGREYVMASNMRQFNVWGTEVEIVSFAQITGHDVYVYTEQKQWARYSHSTISDCELSETAFYISNESGYHFDPIFKN